jgi:hypothetical protein
VNDNERKRIQELLAREDEYPLRWEWILGSAANETERKRIQELFAREDPLRQAWILGSVDHFRQWLEWAVSVLRIRPPRIEGDDRD